MVGSKNLPNIVISLILFSVSAAQPPELSWFKSYGGRYLDQGESIIQTADRGYIIAGYSYVSVTGGTDIYVIKTNNWGVVQWENEYGGASDDWASCIQLTDDGGYIIAGGTESYGAEGSDVLLMKLDYDGEIMWMRTYGGIGDESANYIQQTSDGSFVVSGWTDSFGAGYDDIYLLKTNLVGDLIWSRTFGDQFYDKGFAVKETNDGGYVFICGINYFGYYPVDSYLIKTNADGDTIWTSIIGGSRADACNALAETHDGGFIIAGWTMSFGAGQHDFYLVKVDSVGTEKWYKAYGGIETDVARAIYPIGDGGYIVAGYTASFGNGEYDVYLVKINYKGDSLWTDTFGGADYDYASDVIESYDGGIAVAGWTRSYGLGSKDVLLLKYDGLQTGVNNCQLPVDFYLGQNYPNPFNENAIIEFSIPGPGFVSLKVYDMLGREVAELVNGNINVLSHRLMFNASELASGMYVYKLQADGYSESKKMVLLK